ASVKHSCRCASVWFTAYTCYSAVNCYVPNRAVLHAFGPFCSVMSVPLHFCTWLLLSFYNSFCPRADYPERGDNASAADVPWRSYAQSSCCRHHLCRGRLAGSAVPGADHLPDRSRRHPGRLALRLQG